MKTQLKLLTNAIMILALVCNSCSKDGEIGPIGPQGAQGPTGPQGAQGTQGEDGNANVLSYDITVAKLDWSTNFHYGGNNNYRNYSIPADSVEGISVGEFYNAGNLILAYARISYDTGAGYGSEINTKQLPFLTTVSKGSTKIGIRIELSAPRSDFLLTKTTTGFDATSLADADVPDTTNFRIVFIEASNASSGKSGRKGILGELRSAGVDLGDYKAVMDYFGLEY